MDLKLDKDTHKEAIIGKEGVHHKVENEKNYPIYWQARVRKDPILAEAFNKNQEAAKRENGC